MRQTNRQEIDVYRQHDDPNCDCDIYQDYTGKQIQKNNNLCLFRLIPHYRMTTSHQNNMANTGK